MRLRSHYRRGIPVILFAFLVFSVVTSAQIQTGSISIRAVDEQGGVIPGVTVTLSSPVMPRPITGVTGTDGVYQVPGLGIGSYTVRTSLTGFQTVIRENVIVRQGKTATLDIAMKVSTMS